MRIFKKIIKSFFIGLVAVFFVAVGIDAADHYDDLSESVMGRIFFGESAGPCPADMIFIPTSGNGYCIDKYEASPGKGCPELNISGQSQTRTNLDAANCKPESVAGAIPWNFISLTQAEAACAKAGKRLPTDEEWYQASLNTPDKDSGWTNEDCQVKNNWERQPGQTGTGKDCLSSYGAFDMIGNVWEWVKAEASDGIFKGKKLPPSGYITSIDINGLPIETSELKSDPNFNNDYFWIKASGARGMARGGYYDNESDAGFYSVYLDSPTSFAGVGIGFRCAK